MRLPLLLLLLGCRPDRELPGGFMPADDARFVDGADGLVRVHFSGRGPNAVDSTDQDADGIPDRAEATAASLEGTIRLYETWGFRRPPPESELGLPVLGGSDALDVYLLDLTDTPYGGAAAPDGCMGARCGVHLVVPSDDDDDRFVYESTIRHELFHAVQAGYDYFEPGWLLEGAAEWAGSVAAGNVSGASIQGYLDATECGLAQINGLHPCEQASYGAALLWFHLDQSGYDDALVHTIEATVAFDGVDALEAGLAASGTSVAEVWPTFAAWNLAMGPRDSRWGYDFGRFSDGVTADAEGAVISVPVSIAPLSARYFRVAHAGGALWLGVDGDPGPLVVTVHPVEDGHADGALEPTRGIYGLPSGGPLDLGDFDAGGVWIALSHPEPHGATVDIGLCIGAEAEVDPCRPGVHPWTAEGGCTSSGRTGSGALGLFALALVVARGRRR